MWTTVKVTKRRDTGKLNSSPVTSTAPVIRVQQNCERVIHIRGKSSFPSLLLADTGNKLFQIFFNFISGVLKYSLKRQ